MQQILNVFEPLNNIQSDDKTKTRLVHAKEWFLIMKGSWPKASFPDDKARTRSDSNIQQCLNIVQKFKKHQNIQNGLNVRMFKLFNKYWIMFKKFKYSIFIEYSKNVSYSKNIEYIQNIQTYSKWFAIQTFKNIQYLLNVPPSINGP